MTETKLAIGTALKKHLDQLDKDIEHAEDYVVTGKNMFGDDTGKQQVRIGDLVLTNCAYFDYDEKVAIRDALVLILKTKRANLQAEFNQL